MIEKYFCNNNVIISSGCLQIPPAIMSPAESIDSVKFMSTTSNHQPRSDDWSLATKIAVASITSQGTMGGLIVAGFVSVLCSKNKKNLFHWEAKFILSKLFL